MKTTIEVPFADLKKLAPAGRQLLIPFTSETSKASAAGVAKCWTAYHYAEFLPLGLLFWGATDETFVHEVRVGNQCEVMATDGAIPARYFEAGHSFEKIRQLAEQGELALSVADRAILEMMPAHANSQVRVTTSGPFDNFCMWGVCKDDHSYVKEMRVRPVVDSSGITVRGGYRGQIIEHTLAGERVRFEATAPSEASVVAMLTKLVGAP